jgi:hypothetical protein
MSTLERDLIEKISHLDAEKQKWVMEYVERIERTSAAKVYAPSELMRLPAEERSQIMRAAFDRASDEKFEIFEAYSEEPLDDAT